MGRQCHVSRRIQSLTDATRSRSHHLLVRLLRQAKRDGAPLATFGILQQRASSRLMRHLSYDAAVELGCVAR